MKTEMWEIFLPCLFLLILLGIMCGDGFTLILSSFIVVNICVTSSM